MLISSETGSLVAMTFSELIPLSQIIEDSVRTSSLILAAMNCSTCHMATVCSTYADSYVQKIKLQLPKHSFYSIPLYFICLHFIFQAVHQKECSTAWIFLASKEEKNILGEERGIYWLHLDAYRPRQWFSCQKHTLMSHPWPLTVTWSWCRASSSPLGIPFPLAFVLWGLEVQSSRDHRNDFYFPLCFSSHCS